ncbi:hypothetical protein BSKO_13174 [Bryopsis sp. KO-2023]|nr:hypothetical protein BSKO_13174 [Bryopsis sp. KO-2023]
MSVAVESVEPHPVSVPAPGSPKTNGAEGHPLARIQVSLGKKPLFFYVNLAKRMLQEHGVVKLTALGFAMSNMVSVAEILKKDGLVVEKALLTSVDMLTDHKGRRRPDSKPKMEITLEKSDRFDTIMKEWELARAEQKENGAKEVEVEVEVEAAA